MNEDFLMNRCNSKPPVSVSIVLLLIVLSAGAGYAQEGSGQAVPPSPAPGDLTPGAQSGTGEVIEEYSSPQEMAEGTGMSAEPPLPSTQEVMDHLDDLYRADSSHSRMTMDVVTENWSRTLEMESWTRGDDDALIIIRSPAREAGTATLRTEEGLWNYAPRADRLVRIPSGLLSDSWMGSHFTNDDLMRESDYEEDFDSDLAWAEVDGTRYLQVIMTPHPDAAVVYTKLEYLLTVDRWIPVRGDFYDEEDLVRSFLFSNVQLVDGRPIPFVMEVIPHDKPEESTRIEYLEHEIDIPVDESLFTPRGLRRAAQRQ